MPVDTSMYAPHPQQNPLEMLSGMAGVAQQLQGAQRLGLENVDLQRTMAAHQAVGQAAQAATDPTSGEVDPAKFMAGVAGNPDAAYGAVDAQQQALAMRNAQLAQAHEQYSVLNGSISALLAKPGVSSKDVTNQVGTLVASGVLTPKVAASELASMPTDPAQLTPWLRQHLARGLDAQGQIAAIIGNPQAVDTGPNVSFVRAPSMGQLPGPIAKGLSPEAAASPVAGPTENGAPTTVPLGQRAGMGIVKTGITPAEGAAQGTMGAGVAQDALAFENAARTAPDMSAALKNMTGDLSQLATGPGSHNRNAFVAAVNSFLGTHYDAEKVATQEGFDKLAAQVSARQRQMLGMSNTDAQTNIMAGASPGSQLSKLGNANQIAIIKGNNDALAAENRAWEAYKASGKGAETFHQFTTVFNKHVDPLVFQMQYMTDAQKKSLVGAMSQAEKDRLAQSLAFARHNGLLQQ